MASDCDDLKPASGEDPRWEVPVEDAWVLLREEPPHAPRLDEALLTLADGLVGTRGCREDAVGPRPGVFVSGAYTSGEVTWLNGPHWFGLSLDTDDHTPVRRVLDLRSATLVSEYPTREGTVRTLRFAPAGRPGVVVLHAQGPVGVLDPGAALVPPPSQPGVTVRHETSGELETMSVDGSVAEITAVAAQRASSPPSRPSWRTIERVTAFRSRPGGGALARDPRVAVRTAMEVGIDALLEEHRSVWADRWRTAEIEIDGDPEIEFGARFAAFHLLSSVASTGDPGVGARGLSGPAYQGHVLWDADVFVLPALAAMNPPAARAMLEYRIRRLDAARSIAAERGFQGARFPWESAGDGRDVTPTEYRDPQGQVTRIWTGELEEHIVADVAWAAAHYADWVGDDAFIDGPGRALLTDTARYWASRVRLDDQGRAHLDHVLGPDEYHDAVDDNAYTNVMARWNLRAAADLVARHGPPSAEADQARHWRDIADALVDGFDPSTRCYEQFAGYFRLEPLVMAQFAEPPIAADVLLGADRVRSSQIIKQADVLMLHHLVPEQVAPDSLGPNLDFYLPRTAHGSSLSPAIHASLLARAGRTEQARELLRLACRVDLDDLTNTTAGGLHLATMGGIWQAIVFGFGGVSVRQGALLIDPHLPRAWTQLRICFRFRRRRIALKIAPDRIEVQTDRPLPVSIGPEVADDRRLHEAAPPRACFVRGANGWEEARA